MTITLEMLPVELVADILSELDVASLIVVSGLSRRLRAVVSDVSEHTH
jgi:F-box domain